MKPAIFAACLSLALPGRAQAVECADFWTWVESGCRHVVDTYHHGDDALLVSGYEWHIPYAWTTYWGDRVGLQGGLGFAAAIVQRPDIVGGWPVPVVLPLFTLRYQKAELLTSYIPRFGGGVNHGSVLYFFGKIDLK